MISTIFVLAWLVGGGSPDTVPVDPCASRKASASVEAFIVVPPMRARDTVVTAAVCVVPPRTAGSESMTKIGSYHGELYFDSTKVKVLRVEKPPGGIRVENTKLRGQLNFAGAEPGGFPVGPLINVVLRVSKPGARPAMRLKLRELNATDGTSMMKQLAAPATKSP